MKKNKYIYGTIAATTAITLATVGASNVSANTQYGIQLNRVTGEWQTVNNATGEIVKSVPNETYSSYEEAEASLMASTVETPVTTETPAAETTAVEAPKTAAEAKSEVDAQAQVVADVQAQAETANHQAQFANSDVSNAQAAVDTATQAVADAEANATKATPENIAANQSDQTANLADQEANAAETDEVNAEIASQTQAVADAQTAVNTAQAEKDQADATVVSKQADVKAAQDALSGTGLAEAQATLDQATADVKTAEDNVATATTAVDTAKRADADRQTKIDAATTDVAVKTDAVDTAKAKLTAAQDTVKTTTEAVTKATDAVKSATDALANSNEVSPQLEFSEDTLEKLAQFGDILRKLKDVYEKKSFKLDPLYKSNIKADEEAMTITKLLFAKEAELHKQETQAEIRNVLEARMSVITTPYDSAKLYTDENGNLTLSQEAYSAWSIRSVEGINYIRKAMGFEDSAIATIRSSETAKRTGESYQDGALRYLTISKSDSDEFAVNPYSNHGRFNAYNHEYIFNGNSYYLYTDHESLSWSIGFPTLESNYEPNYVGTEEDTVINKRFISGIATSLYILMIGDADSVWGHLDGLLTNAQYGFAHTAQNMAVITAVSKNRVVVPSEIDVPLFSSTSFNDSATLQAALTQAQAALTAAQTASDEAKAKLTQASSDYATALELKTQAEKTLADATATPLQTQVAENNLRLAEIALQNAEARKADAQKAVDNFSADLATKKSALDTAKTELAQAQATATAKAEALETAKAELAKQQDTLDSLNKDKVALLAEKDRLVEEAKALAEELDGYMNAPARLADAQATLTEKQAALTEAQAKAETAQNKLETVTAKLAEEKAKLSELQAEYNKLKDLEDKAKDNVIATLPDGTIVAVPKVAPTVAEKPAVDVDAVKQALDKGQDVTVVDGKVVVANPQAGVTVTPQGITYSRVERAKTLPNTGEQTSLLALAGVAVLSSLGLASARRRKQG
ncbi:SEC10/PgrA surface exclusion domain-containing protein [Streptococcus suis]